MAIVRLASLVAGVAFAGVLLGSGYWWLVVVMTVFSFFWNASLPQFEAVTLTYLAERAHRYTRIRVWGSIGFILAVVWLGPVLDRYGVGFLPWALVGLMIAIWGSSLVVPERVAARVQVDHEPLLRVLRRPEVMALLAACLLLQMSHGPYYSFYSIYLAGYGYSRTLIGELWALGVLAEVVLFVFMHRMLVRFGLRNLFLWSFALTALRWLLIALYPEQIGIMLAAQLLHAASFGLYHAVAIQLIHRFFVGRHQGRGQALYSSLSFGAGGALGSLASGYAWDSAGPAATYLGAAVASALGLFIVWRWVDRPRAAENADHGGA